MRNAFRKTMVAGMKKAVINEIETEIASVYDHTKHDKKQILGVVLSSVIMDNKDIKSFVEDTLKDSGITIRWGRVIRAEESFLVEATVRVPAHFYSDQKLSKREWKKNKEEISDAEREE